MIAVLPDRVHVLVEVPPDADRRSVSAKLQDATTQLLADGHVVSEQAGSVWAGDGWCAVLPSAVAASTVRRVLREKVATYRGAERRPDVTDNG